MQKARCHSTKLLRPLVSVRFQVLFHSLCSRVLFTFPSRYLFTIGLSGVFSLTRWSWQIHTGFLVSRATQDTTRYIIAYVYEAITLYGCNFPNRFHFTFIYRYVSPTTPALPKQYWFGLFPFRSPLLRESLIVFFSSRYLDVSVLRVCLHCWILSFS